MTQIVIPRSIVTADPVTSEVTCTAGQAVVVEGGIITEVAPAAEIETRHPDVELQRFPHAILTPGFVNSHHHVGLTPFQLGVPDSSLETWIAARAAHPTLDLRLDTTYSAVQMLRSGVTTVQHVQGWHSTDASDLTASARAVLDTYGEIGMRGSYSKMVRDQNLLIHDQDETLLDRLPVEQHDRFSAYLKGLRVPLAEQLSLFEELHATYADDPLLVVQLAPANFHWTSDEALEQLGETSARTGVPMHMHVLETIYQSMYMDRRAGAERVSYLARSGVLSDRLTLGHGTWLRDTDIEALADVGAHVCHNCSSNFRLSSGRLPVHDLLDAGVNVAIGIDEAGINDDRDMLQEMRMVWTVNREPGISRRRLTAEQVFTMATVGGARTTSYRPGHGTITAGAPADLVLFEEDTLRHPFQLPGVSEAELIVQRSRSEAITDVMIGGAWVMSGSRLTTIDEEAFTAEIVDACASVDLDAFAEDTRFAAALKVAVGGWFVEEYGL
ncbi:8-oxoguanine deaminase [Pseudonocardia aurantiaca]|uniref:Amidohydrolase family protein n=1 Tax=Pseudonocardia aurantiaca TaxID=75290 RepID=A0ABW4FMG8_9PSEU